MTGQILAVLLVPLLHPLWALTRRRETPEVLTASADLIELPDLEWDFELFNDRDPLARASESTVKKVTIDEYRDYYN